MTGRLSGLRVCMVTSAHPPHDARICYKEAVSLAKHGAEVTILYPSNRQLDGGPEGIQFATFRSEKRGLFRVFNNANIKSALHSNSYDVLHCHEPDALRAAIIANRTGIAKIIYDSHELWSGVFAQRIGPALLWGVLQRAFIQYETRLLRDVDGIIGATDAITMKLSKLVPAIPSETILNVPLSSEWPSAEAVSRRQDRIWFCHEGNLSVKRGLRTILQAFKRVRQKFNVGLRIIGAVPGTDLRWMNEYCLANRISEEIDVTGWLKYNEVGKRIGECHIGIIAFPDTPNNRIAGPNKCFNYMKYGLPVLAPDFPESHFAVLEREGAAELFIAGSESSLADSMIRLVSRADLLRSKSQIALDLASKKYNWEVAEEKLIQLYQAVLASDK